LSMAQEQPQERDLSPGEHAESWHDVGLCSDIPGGQYKRVSLGQKEILIVNLNGEFFAIDSLCSHMRMDLMGGRILGDCITCPHHGAQFRISDGAAAGYPAVRPIATFEVQVREGRVHVRE